MAAFLIDEDVSVKVADVLASRGHDAITVDELRRKGSKDDAVLWIAARLRRILVTHNAGDFTMLHRAWYRWQIPERHAGILIPKQHVICRPLEIAERVCEFIALGRPIENELYTFEADLSWHRFDTRGAISDTLNV